MVKKIKLYYVILFSLSLFIGCNKEDDYFAEPDWLQKPLYEILQSEGNFSNYLACIDRTLYAGQIKEGGYFTLIAPNDNAFATFLQQNGYSSVADIPQEVVNKIVAYSMVQSYWLSENLGDIFTGTVGNRYSVGDGLKKQTYYYETLYKDPEYSNNWVIDQNIDGTTFSQSSDNNFKYYPVFMQNYFSKSNLTATDYNEFFPNTQYVGGETVGTGVIGNIYNGTIIKPNIKGRNGIAHEVSVVNLPLNNMDKYLIQNQYATFKSLLDFKNLSGEYVYKHYTEDAVLAEKYKIVRPNDGINKIYVKSYSTSGEQPLSFSPALEVIYNDNTKNTQSDGYTLFVPSNEILTNYLHSRLLKYYDKLSDLPIEAVTTLINTHMVNTMVWPSQLKSSQVSTGEYINGQGSTGISYYDFGVIDKKLTSNGFIYTIDHVIKSKLFETVYSEIFLNPAYLYLNAAYIKYYGTSSLKDELMKSKITGYPNHRYTSLLISDEQFKNDGFSYNTETSNFSNSLLVNTNVTDRIRRLMRLHLFEGWVDAGVDSEVKFDDGISDYGGWGFRNTTSGDVVRYKNNQLQATGNIEDNTVVNITKGETFDNGTVYTIDKTLQYSQRESAPTLKEGWNSNTLWYYIRQTGTENTNVSQFADYVQYALKSTTTDELLGISEDNFYTIVMPNNNALTRARLVGDLPNLDSLKNGLLSTGRIEMCIDFLKSHFLQGYELPDDRQLFLYPYNINSPYTNIVSTMYRINKESKGLINQRTNILVSKDDAGKLVFTPQNVTVDGINMVVGEYGLTTPAPRIMTGTAQSGNNGYRSNRIAGRAIHHEYTNYFKFTIQN